jgi:hypothetical protein
MAGLAPAIHAVGVARDIEKYDVRSKSYLKWNSVFADDRVDPEEPSP